MDIGGSTFVLNGTTLATIGGVIGALSTTIVWLGKQLVGSKDAQIAGLSVERDYWRDMALSLIDPANKALGLAEEQTRLHAHYPPRGRA